MTARSTARVAALLGAALFVMAWVILPANPALACSCAIGSVEEQAAGADAIFLGQVVDVREPPAVDGMVGSDDPVSYVVAVSRVYKGEVGATQEVVSARSGASCGLELPDSGPVLFFATGDPQATPTQLSANLCGGTVATATAPALLGDGQPPPEAAASPLPSTVGPESAASAGSGANEGPSLTTWGLALGLAALVAMGTALVLRRGRLSS